MSRATDRGRLTRERILGKALELADERGIESLKMRDLAHELGFEAMALYRHVGGKDDILAGILDLVLAEVEPAPLSDDWAASIRASAVSLHQALERHPWAARLLVSPPGLRPARLEFGESLLARLEDAGFPEDIRYHAYHVLDAHIIGYSLWITGHPHTPAEREEVERRLANDVSLSDYPHLLSHHDQHRAEGPHRGVDAFEVGLDLILSGLSEQSA